MDVLRDITHAGRGTLTDFELEFRKSLIDTLGIDNIDPESIVRDTVLFKDGLGLDSVDAIDLVILIENNYGIVLTVPERNRTVFANFGVLCDFLREHRNRDMEIGERKS